MEEAQEDEVAEGLAAPAPLPVPINTSLSVSIAPPAHGLGMPSL